MQAREIIFPPIHGIQFPFDIAGNHGDNPMDLSASRFAGLTTYANLPYVHCLADSDHQVEPFDIAIVGAPFDTVSWNN